MQVIRVCWITICVALFAGCGCEEPATISVKIVGYEKHRAKVLITNEGEASAWFRGTKDRLVNIVSGGVDGNYDEIWDGIPSEGENAWTELAAGQSMTDQKDWAIAYVRTEQFKIGYAFASSKGGRETIHWSDVIRAPGAREPYKIGDPNPWLELSHVVVSSDLRVAVINANAIDIANVPEVVDKLSKDKRIQKIIVVGSAKEELVSLIDDSSIYVSRQDDSEVYLLDWNTDFHNPQNHEDCKYYLNGEYLGTSSNGFARVVSRLSSGMRSKPVLFLKDMKCTHSGSLTGSEKPFSMTTLERVFKNRGFRVIWIEANFNQPVMAYDYSVNPPVNF